jgi:opacity protein-like surface antigen
MKTKNAILLLALLMGSSFTSFGQNIKLGVQLGSIFSTVSEPGNIYDNDHLRAGFSAGLQANYTLHQNWMLRSGLVFEEKGFHEEHHFSSGTQVIKGDLNYLTLPVCIGGMVPINEKVNLFGMVGPYFSLLVKENTQLLKSGTESQTPSLNSGIKNQDAGWTAGCGVDFSLMNHKTELLLKYSQGMTKLYDLNTDDRNKSLSLGLSFFL